MGSADLGHYWGPAWAISTILSSIVFAVCRKAGFARSDCLMIAAAFFLSPLGYVYGSLNSAIYVFDFFIPLAILSAVRSWGEVPTSMKQAGLLILFAAGILPALLSLARENPFDAFSNFINAVRLTGCVALMLHCSDRRRFIHVDREVLLQCFSILSIVLLCAMFLNGTELLKTDLYTHINSTSSGQADPTDLNFDRRFLALGLFRGNAGILGSLGVFAFLAKSVERWPSILAVAGALSGLGVIILSGSKTSLTAVGIVFLFWIMRSAITKLTKRVAVIAVISSFVVTVIASGLYLQPSYRPYVPPLMLSYLGLDQRVQTTALNGRVDRWTDCVDALSQGPAALFGLTDSHNLQYNVSFFHSEYMSMFMLGGVLGSACYALGLLCLWWAVGRSRAPTPIVAFAQLSFVSGLIHGVSVAHLQPAILYISCVAVTCAAYGLASGSRRVEVAI